MLQEQGPRLLPADCGLSEESFTWPKMTTLLLIDAPAQVWASANAAAPMHPGEPCKASDKQLDSCDQPCGSTSSPPQVSEAHAAAAASRGGDCTTIPRMRPRFPQYRPSSIKQSCSSTDAEHKFCRKYRSSIISFKYNVEHIHGIQGRSA